MYIDEGSFFTMNGGSIIGNVCSTGEGIGGGVYNYGKFTKTGTVTMLKDSTENVTIAAGQTITLDLNGKTLTAKDGGSVIIVRGSLTLINTRTSR